jgi:hypothetical protein
MVTAEFQTFFLASVGASAALIGLLFVSVSIAPERVFGQESDGVRQAQALSAFTALANVFFISLMSLIPDITFGLVVAIVSIPAFLQTLALLRHLRNWRAGQLLARGLILFVASGVIYGYEFALGIGMWRDPSDKAALISLTFVLIGAYGAGLGRAWELLGAPRTGIVPSLWAVLTSLRPQPPEAKPKA